ncbi:MAG TPA: hypothetical protein VMF08_15280 [Candidatus Sulfotelmatobacter sp.]|nr:hypothetical protein [Candidatus Sulfotelmatobacter sp.]
MILSAIAGFLIGIGFSLADNCSWSTAFWRACVCALGAALLARWWTNVCLENLRDALRQRQYKRSVPAPKPRPATKT